MPNEFKIKNGLVVEQGPSQITGSLLISGSTTITGSLSVTEGITGSLEGTASFASTASYVNPLNQIIQVTGSVEILDSGASISLGNNTGIQINTSGQGVSIISNQGQALIVAGGSNGNNIATFKSDNTDETLAYISTNGSIFTTGSLTAIQGITGSLEGTASFAQTASFAPSYTPIATPITSGLEITFTQDRLYGTLSTPETGSIITANTSSAIPLVTNLIIHSASAAPTTGSDFKKIIGSQDYVAGVNYIYCTYMQDNQINYLITQTE